MFQKRLGFAAGVDFWLGSLAERDASESTNGERCYGASFYCHDVLGSFGEIGIFRTVLSLCSKHGSDQLIQFAASNPSNYRAAGGSVLSGIPTR